MSSRINVLPGWTAALKTSLVMHNPSCYDPKEELCENCRCPNCACRVYIGAIKTLTLTYLLLGLIEFQFNCDHQL